VLFDSLNPMVEVALAVGSNCPLRRAAKNRGRREASMLRFLVARVSAMLVMALLATLVVFLITNTVPGDPVLAQLGDQAASDPAFVAEWRHQYGLDRPLWERYVIFLNDLRQGDLGRSIRSHRPVLDDVEEYAPATLELATISFILTLVVGIPLGILAAVKRDSWVDHLARVISLLGVSSPTFWLAFILLAVFYGYLQIAPGPGRLDPIALSPPTVTGSYLIDSALAGDWQTFHDAAQCAGAGGHAGRACLREPADWRSADRNRVLLARTWPLHFPECGGTRLSRDHGDHSARGGHVSGSQSAH
jgi:hypothetical protein